MKLIDLTCPNCSAKLKLDRENRQAICGSCGTTFLIDEQNPERIPTKAEVDNQNRIDKLNKIALINKNMSTNTSQASESDRAYSSYSQTKTTDSSSSSNISIVLWIIGFLFFFPIAASVLIYKSNLPSKSKIPLIIALWIVLLFFVFVFGSTEPTNKSSESTVVTQTTTAATVEEISNDNSATVDEEAEYHRDEIINEIIVRYNDITECPLNSDEVGSRQMNSQAVIHYSNGVDVTITHGSLNDSLFFEIVAEHPDDTVILGMLIEWCMAIDPTLSYDEIVDDYNAVKNKNWDDFNTYYMNTMTIDYWDTPISNGLHRYRVQLNYPNISEA